MKMTVYIINVWHTPALFVCKLEISKLVIQSIIFMEKNGKIHINA